jgi:hypothetical protein
MMEVLLGKREVDHEWIKSVMDFSCTCTGE